MKPLSRKFGFDRGTPIDRYWIESFLDNNKSLIKGRCLEITSDNYTMQFGGKRVAKCDVLDIDKNNKLANIVGDIRNLKGIIADNTYDTIILTHVLGLINDYDSAIAETKRILKKGGHALVTSSCFSPTYDKAANYWRFTPLGLQYAFTKHFNRQNIKTFSYGNVLTGMAFWVGMAQEEIANKSLKINDPDFPCITGLIAKK